MNFPISEMQPLYFVAESFATAKTQIIDYCENISRPFNVSYNQKTNTIEVDRKIKTREEELWDKGIMTFRWRRILNP